jgi:hypothetical protein
MNMELDGWISYIESLPKLSSEISSENLLSDLAFWVIESRFTEAERDRLAVSLAAAIDETSSFKQQTSLLFILRKVHPHEAVTVASRLLESVVQQTHDLASLLYHVVDCSTEGLNLEMSERNTSPMDVQENLRIAERVLADRGVFLPW